MANGQFSELPLGTLSVGGKPGADFSLEAALLALRLHGIASGALSGDTVPDMTKIKVLVQMRCYSYTFSGSAGNYYASVTFPQAFPGGLIGVLATAAGGAVAVSAGTKSGCTLYRGVAGGATVFWVAFGW